MLAIGVGGWAHQLTPVLRAHPQPPLQVLDDPPGVLQLEKPWIGSNLCVKNSADLFHRHAL